MAKVYWLLFLFMVPSLPAWGMEVEMIGEVGAVPTMAEEPPSHLVPLPSHLVELPRDLEKLSRDLVEHIAGFLLENEGGIRDVGALARTCWRFNHLLGQGESAKKRRNLALKYVKAFLAALPPGQTIPRDKILDELEGADSDALQSYLVDLAARERLINKSGRLKARRADLGEVAQFGQYRGESQFLRQLTGTCFSRDCCSFTPGAMAGVLCLGMFIGSILAIAKNLGPGCPDEMILNATAGLCVALGLHNSSMIADPIAPSIRMGPVAGLVVVGCFFAAGVALIAVACGINIKDCLHRLETAEIDSLLSAVERDLAALNLKEANRAKRRVEDRR